MRRFDECAFTVPPTGHKGHDWGRSAPVATQNARFELILGVASSSGAAIAPVEAPASTINMAHTCMEVRSWGASATFMRPQRTVRFAPQGRLRTQPPRVDLREISKRGEKRSTGDGSHRGRGLRHARTPPTLCDRSIRYVVSARSDRFVGALAYAMCTSTVGRWASGRRGPHGGGPGAPRDLRSSTARASHTPPTGTIGTQMTLSDPRPAEDDAPLLGEPVTASPGEAGRVNVGGAQ